MNAVAVGLSAGSLVVVTTTVVNYFSKVADAKVPKEITNLVLALLFGIALAGSAVAWSLNSGSIGVAVVAPAAFATMLASMLLWILTQRMTPVGDLKVQVGDKLPAFEATTSDGAAFHTDELGGKRTLLKFFRGGW